MINFSSDFLQLLKILKECAYKVDDYPIIIGGYIRDLLYYGKSSGDVDIVLKRGKNYNFVQELVTSYGLGMPNEYNNTGTINLIVKDFSLEFQSAKNKLIHFDIDDELDLSGIKKNWLTRNVYERDFTINTIIYDPLKNKIVDKTGFGIDDLLHNKIIRCPIDPMITVRNCPNIIARAIKFANQFDLEIKDDFIEAAKVHKNTFIGFMVSRNNKNFMQRVIEDAFSYNFDRAYKYFKTIDFLDILPKSKNLEEQINYKELGLQIMSSNKNNSKHLMDFTNFNNMDISTLDTYFHKKEYEKRKRRKRKRDNIKTFKWMNLLDSVE